MAGKRNPAQNQLENYFKEKGNLGIVTTSTGEPIAYKDASVTVGKKGPIVLSDWELLDELSHFNRERIPERVVHAKGGGAFGYFQVTTDITKYTEAKVFSKVNKKTEMAVRFSRVAGEHGAADTPRDLHGFAMKFYTDDGIWDLVGNNTPIFFIRDPILFPHFIHTQKRNPVTNLRDPTMVWDFFSLRPETTHQVLWLYSDRGIPDGFRHMDGFGSHTFSLINKDQKVTYCKFHFKTDQEIKNLDPKIATQLAGSNPDYYIEDLYNAIANGDYPSWTMYIQVMTPEQAANSSVDPFDLTKTWSKKTYPLMEVGKFVLNRNATNYFAEIEQLAFNPSSFVPGINGSPDRMLQGRIFAYHDSHIYRLGANYAQLPVNCPFKVNNFQRDGKATINNKGGAPNYHPNSFGGPNSDLKLKRYQNFQYVEGKIGQYDTIDEDNFSQATDFYKRVLKEDERQRLVNNIVDDLGGAAKKVQDRAVENFKKVDLEFANKVRDGLKRKATVNV
ncbi:PREDICTED: catalase-like [Nicrophorus vespilloides]|uniref:Catalase n=1 Tax=Nicrophorus vespilloides TaxID=110193 RepID=A0ABM1N712_NICVS|nr:PREDICTED: catalase-like [Nicrophorus vespilloides]